MSTTIDRKVVEMRFDNKQFENNIATTMSTLEKFKQKLSLTGATKGMEQIDAAARKVDLSQLEYTATRAGFQIQDVWLKVASVFEYQIARRIIDSAKRITRAFTIDPIKTGFSEYETQINAVQTILANTESKGTTLQDVNAALDQLNTYADKTIYNFTEMTKNIGTFTAAGVDLDTSVNAIQGIANLAAVSGSTSQQASTAMYQLSQALSSGTVKLMDWNSVVNAGMGGQVFQDALKETARVHGIAIDDMIEKNGSFRETLQEGWLTSDILTETLSHFTMAAEEGSDAWNAYKKSLMDDGYTEEQATAILKLSNTATDAATKVKTFSQLMDTLKEATQSGWTQSWEIIIGNFEEAKGFLTDISDRIGSMIGESAEARNAILSGGLSTGWQQLLNQGIADEEGYKETLKECAKAHNVSIDDMVAAEKKLDNSLSDTEAFQKALTKGLSEGKLTNDMFTESVLVMATRMSRMSAEELKAAGYTVEHVEQIKKLADGLVDGSVSMDEFTKAMTRPSGRENIIQALWNAFDGLMSMIEPIKKAFKDIFPSDIKERADQLYNFTVKLKELTAKLTLSETASENLRRTFRGLFAVVDIVKEVFIAVFKALGPLFGKVDDLGGGILGVTAKWGDWLVSLRDSIKEGNIFGKAVEKIHKAFAKVRDFIQPAIDGVKNFGKTISDDFATIANNAETRLQPLVALGNFLKSIFVGLGKLIQKIFPYISAAATGIGNVLKSLMDTISDAIQGADYDKVFDVANGGIMTAIGVYIAKMFKSGSGIFDGAAGFVENLNSILEGAGDALGAFTDSLKADTLKKIAIAIGILAASLLVLSLIPSEKLTTALGSVTAMFIELMGAMSIFGKISGGKGIKDMLAMNTMAKAMTTLASAILVLSIALKIMSTMSWSEMGVALITMTVGLGELVGAVWLLSMLPEKQLSGSVNAIKKLASALLVLSVALKIMGTMSWEEMGVALISMTAALGALVGVVWALPKEKELASASRAISSLSKSLIIMAVALKIMGSMSWEEMGIALISMVGALGAMIGVIWALPKDVGSKATGILVLAAALTVLAGALKIMASMSWEEMIRGLATMAIALGAMIGVLWALEKAQNLMATAAALVVLSSALVVLGIALNSMANMSWEEVARGLLTLAGAFVIIGIAGYVLGPMAGAIATLAGAIALLGVGILAAGVGVLAFGAGITALAAALASGGLAITVFVSSLISLIPYLIEQIGVGIIRLCEVIAGSAAAICDAFTVIILALVDAIVASVPALVEGVFVLIDELLLSLVKHTPIIVGALFDFLIALIDALAAKLPDLIQAGVNLLMAFFVGVVNALKSIDPTALIQGLVAIGIMTALVAALAAVAAMVPAAMVGVVGLGLVMTELALVLAGIGAIAQIPGLDWLISEGGQFMQKIGTAIGQFIGGILGGIAQGMTSSLPQIGVHLSEFMTNAKPFIDGAKGIDAGTLDGVKSLVEIILALTGANILESVTSWLTGGSSLTKFGEELAAFAPNIKMYADTVKGIDATAVEASANAAKTLAELATNLPNSGGLAGWFAGENDIGAFGKQLVPFGEGMKSYSDAITGFDAEAVVASANAATAIADMTSHIPSEGGMVAWFTGENSVSRFSTDLVRLGMGLRMYSLAIAGFDSEAVIASANAATALVEMTSSIPNEGGMVAWFTGENSVASWGNQLVILGNSLARYSLAIAGFDSAAVIASANAAKSLVDMTSAIPNEGGMVAWFTGENSISKFGSEIIALGLGLAGFSIAVSGINTQAVTAATSAAYVLARMTAYIPNEGGMVAWFTGENSISKFGSEIISLGNGLAGFSTAVAGINTQNVIAAANAAYALAKMSSYIPNEGGMAAWFTGDNSVAKFANQLPTLGTGLKGFPDSVAGIVPENITAAANAATKLAKMAEATPDNTGILPIFGRNLVIFGGNLKTYFEKMAGVTSGVITSSTNAVNAIKTSTTGLDANKVKSASDAISSLVSSLSKMSKIKATAANGFSAALKRLGEVNVQALIASFKNAGSDMRSAGQELVAKFTSGAESQTTKVNAAGKTLAERFIDGFVSSESKMRSAAKSLVTIGSNAIATQASKFKSAGQDLGSGLVNGINAKQTAVYNAAYALGQKAVQGEKDGQASNSPSKLTMQAGNWFGEGLVIGIQQMGRQVYKAGSGLGETATDSLSSTISRVADVINTDIDSQPTIRPVLDLSDVRSGASAIGSMLDMDSSVGVMANVGAINSMMNRRIQNGGNGDVVSAIDKLRKDLGNVGGTTYSINGVTYTAESDVADAVRTIARAIKVEGRV